MITSKQRSYLKGLAHSIDPSVYLGKGGLTENIIKEVDINLEARELVKVKLQEGCGLEPKEVANQIAEQLGAEFVQAIGRKFTLYRESKENKQIELPKAKK
ncbi:ribosome assembly RNA-binding protein YhbY [Aminipila sp.]|uniref:ribosome assembly RNA-binding protein YhbY n=1 Tax=Aminipila sp. TaxID=2060095 RepID=UPI001DE5559B|nr:ribosome assembly RNA-binding protein YhbY [Aminipila sp.]MBE6033536.1 ribosome assembly RNA-binding protein YhbY [Clostridiales bacterium]